MHDMSLEVIDHLITSCPNIENLHIGKKRIPNIGSIKNANFLSDIRFQHLKFLTLEGFLLFDGSYLASVSLDKIPACYINIINNFFF